MRSHQIGNGVCPCLEVCGGGGCYLRSPLIKLRHSEAFLVELLDQAIEIRVAGSKYPREPISTAFGNPLAVCDHLELTGLTRCNDDFNAQALLDEGRETRDLDLVVLSGRAMNDFDLHSVLQTTS
jgi:hypothetical protein